MTAAPALNFAPMAVHIGEEIERRRVVTGMTKTELADRIGIARQSIYAVLGSPSIDTLQLKRCCRALHFNFFALLAADCEEDFGTPPGAGTVHDPAHVYGRRPAEKRSPLRVVIEVDPGDDEAQARALRMARELQAPAPDRDKEGS